MNMGNGHGGAPRKVNILIVDDLEENLLSLEAILDSLGQTIVRARSGEEAMRLALRHSFAVILLDVVMPGVDGFETASLLKRHHRTRDVPIIFLTAAEDSRDATFRGYAVGAADYITKPFDPWVLRAKVLVFVDLYRKNRMLADVAARLASVEQQLRRLMPGDSRAAAVPERRADGMTQVAVTQALEQVAETMATMHEMVQALFPVDDLIPGQPGGLPSQPVPPQAGLWRRPRIAGRAFHHPDRLSSLPHWGPWPLESRGLRPLRLKGR